MKIKHQWVKGHYIFYPVNDIEKSKVQKFNQLESIIDDIPEFYFEEIGIKVYTSYMYRSQNEANILEEAEQSKKKILSLLKAYQK